MRPNVVPWIVENVLVVGKFRIHTYIYEFEFSIGKPLLLQLHSSIFSYNSLILLTVLAFQSVCHRILLALCAFLNITTDSLQDRIEPMTGQARVHAKARMPLTSSLPVLPYLDFYRIN